MFILRDLLPPLQAHFSKPDLSQERSAPLRLSPALGHRSVHFLQDLIPGHRTLSPWVC